MDKVTQPSDSNRRTLQRVPAGLRVNYKYDSHMAEGLTADISEGGIFLLSDKPALPGTKIYLHLHLKSDKPPMKIIGHVRRKVDPNGPKPSGMGISFEVIYADDIQQLKSFVGETLGVPVTESNIAPVKGTGAFKHVIDPPPVRPKAPQTANAKTPQVASARKARTPEERDRYNLKQLDFDDSSWMKRKVLIWVISAVVPVVLYLVIRILLSEPAPEAPSIEIPAIENRIQ